MIDRDPISWLRERDIDLLVCSELQAEGHLRSLFGRTVGVGDAAFLGAWVSHAELEGESDLVLVWSSSSGSIIALVENKVAADFQPYQAARYRSRAQKWAERDDVARAVTILLAPADYMNRSGAGDFDHQLSYEEIGKVLRASDDPRSTFLADAIAAGIASYRRGYVPEPDQAVSDVWQACWKIATELTPKLKLARPSDKPGRSNWIYFRDAEGAGDWRNAVVVYKAERGQADLQFRGVAPAELEARSRALLDPTMTVAKANKSSSIRIAVDPIDFRASPTTQVAAIEAGLMACERLRGLLANHRTQLLPGSTPKPE